MVSVLFRYPRINQILQHICVLKKHPHKFQIYMTMTWISNKLYSNMISFPITNISFKDKLTLIVTLKSCEVHRMTFLRTAGLCLSSVSIMCRRGSTVHRTSLSFLLQCKTFHIKHILLIHTKNLTDAMLRHALCARRSPCRLVVMHRLAWWPLGVPLMCGHTC